MVAADGAPRWSCAVGGLDIENATPRPDDSSSPAVPQDLSDSASPQVAHVQTRHQNASRNASLKTAREYARIKIDGLRLVGGNRDFTNAPGHGDDDARFYDRQ